MVSVRKLPESVTGVLSRARDLEALGRGTHRERATVAAMSALLLAVHDVGWLQSEIAALLGMNRQTVQKRIAAARRAHPHGTGIVVDAPLDRPPTRLAVLRLPVSEREWLSVGEAAEHAGRDPLTIRNWLARGILPNTDRRTSGVHLYLRADLDRVLAAPRRGKRQKYPDFDWLLEQIATSPV